MKAVVCYGNGNIKYEEVADVFPKSNEVKIEVKACGICGSDIPRALSNKAHSYPIILGHEFSGIVSEVGNDVKNILIGDKVTVAPLIPCNNCEDCNNGNYSLCSNYSFIGSRRQGAMAEYVVVPQENIIKLDDNISFEQGALFEPATVALHALRQINYKPSDNVAILGGGTIGLFTMQWVKILGCKNVTVFGRDKDHLLIAKELGADNIISTLDKNFIDVAYKYTNNKGFDYVFESAGSDTTIKYAFQLVKKKGSICFIGTPKNEIIFKVQEWEQINRKEIYLTGSWMSYSKPFPGKEWEMTKRYMGNNTLKFDSKIFYKQFPMKKANEAFSLFKDKTIKVNGRVLLKK